MPVAKRVATESGRDRVRVFVTRKFAGDAKAAAISNDELFGVAKKWAS